MKRFCNFALACAFLVAAGAPRASAQAMGGSMSMSAQAPAFDYQAKFLAT